MDVLLLQAKNFTIPDRVRLAPEIDHLTVITEPSHLQDYGPDADVRLVDDVMSIEETRRAALKVLRERKIDRILTPFELAIPVAGYLRGYFGLPGMGFETANAFTNKFVMKQRLAAAGIPVAECRLAHGLSDVATAELGWPVIAKPIFGGGSFDVTVFHNAAEFDAFTSTPKAHYLRTLRHPLIVERFATVETEYHCDGIIHDGKVVFAAPSEYLVPALRRQDIWGTHPVPKEAPEYDQILDLHARSIEALGMEAGVTHMEILRTPDGLLVGEIACRPGGMRVVDSTCMRTGVDIWRGFLETSLGLPPTVDPIEKPRMIGHLRLAMQPGRIVRLSRAEDFTDLPGVLKVEMVRKVGDMVPTRLASADASGFVYFTFTDLAERDKVVRQVYERYEFEVDNV